MVFFFCLKNLRFLDKPRVFPPLDPFTKKMLFHIFCEKISKKGSENSAIDAFVDMVKKWSASKDMIFEILTNSEHKVMTI